jgi:hypothetical protein
LNFENLPTIFLKSQLLSISPISSIPFRFMNENEKDLSLKIVQVVYKFFLDHSIDEVELKI